MAVRVYVGVGSNLGDSGQVVFEACQRVIHLGSEGRTSSLYRTAPRGGPPQPPYCNAVAVFSTAWTPFQVLGLLRRIEAQFGRTRRQRWGPRILDLDLLLFGDRIVRHPRLTVPHPRLTERQFVLEPLFELSPDLALPDGRTIRALREAAMDQEVIPW